MNPDDVDKLSHDIAQLSLVESPKNGLQKTCDASHDCIKLLKEIPKQEEIKNIYREEVARCLRNLSVPKGFSLFGKTGSGKSTLLNDLFAQEVVPTKGNFENENKQALPTTAFVSEIMRCPAGELLPAIEGNDLQVTLQLIEASTWARYLGAKIPLFQDPTAHQGDLAEFEYYIQNLYFSEDIGDSFTFPSSCPVTEWKFWSPFPKDEAEDTPTFLNRKLEENSDPIFSFLERNENPKTFVVKFSPTEDESYFLYTLMTGNHILSPLVASIQVKGYFPASGVPCGVPFFDIPGSGDELESRRIARAAALERSKWLIYLRSKDFNPTELAAELEEVLDKTTNNVIFVQSRKFDQESLQTYFYPRGEASFAKKKREAWENRRADPKNALRDDIDAEFNQLVRQRLSESKRQRFCEILLVDHILKKNSILSGENHAFIENQLEEFHSDQMRGLFSRISEFVSEEKETLRHSIETLYSFAESIIADAENAPPPLLLQGSVEAQMNGLREALSTAIDNLDVKALSSFIRNIYQNMHYPPGKTGNYSVRMKAWKGGCGRCRVGGKSFNTPNDLAQEISRIISHDPAVAKALDEIVVNFPELKGRSLTYNLKWTSSMFLFWKEAVPIWESQVDSVMKAFYVPPLNTFDAYKYAKFKTFDFLERLIALFQQNFKELQTNLKSSVVLDKLTHKIRDAATEIKNFRLKEAQKDRPPVNAEFEKRFTEDQKGTIQICLSIVKVLMQSSDFQYCDKKKLTFWEAKREIFSVLPRHICDPKSLVNCFLDIKVPTSNMKALVLSFNNVDDSALDAISAGVVPRLPRLEVLDLTGNFFLTYPALERFHNKHPKVRLYCRFCLQKDESKAAPPSNIICIPFMDFSILAKLSEEEEYTVRQPSFPTFLTTHSSMILSLVQGSWHELNLQTVIDITELFPAETHGLTQQFVEELARGELVTPNLKEELSNQVKRWVEILNTTTVSLPKRTPENAKNYWFDFFTIGGCRVVGEIDIKARERARGWAIRRTKVVIFADGEQRTNFLGDVKAWLMTKFQAAESDLAEWDTVFLFEEKILKVQRLSRLQSFPISQAQCRNVLGIATVGGGIQIEVPGTNNLDYFFTADHCIPHNFLNSNLLISRQRTKKADVILMPATASWKTNHLEYNKIPKEIGYFPWYNPQLTVAYNVHNQERGVLRVLKYKSPDGEEEIEGIIVDKSFASEGDSGSAVAVLRPNLQWSIFGNVVAKLSFSDDSEAILCQPLLVPELIRQMLPGLDPTSPVRFSFHPPSSGLTLTPPEEFLKRIAEAPNISPESSIESVALYSWAVAEVFWESSPQKFGNVIGSSDDKYYHASNQSWLAHFRRVYNDPSGYPQFGGQEKCVAHPKSWPSTGKGKCNCPLVGGHVLTGDLLPAERSLIEGTECDVVPICNAHNNKHHMLMTTDQQVRGLRLHGYLLGARDRNHQQLPIRNLGLARLSTRFLLHARGNCLYLYDLPFRTEPTRTPILDRTCYIVILLVHPADELLAVVYAKEQEYWCSIFQINNKAEVQQAVHQRQICPMREVISSALFFQSSVVVITTTSVFTIGADVLSTNSHLLSDCHPGQTLTQADRIEILFSGQTFQFFRNQICKVSPDGSSTSTLVGGVRTAVDVSPDLVIVAFDSGIVCAYSAHDLTLLGTENFGEGKMVNSVRILENQVVVLLSNGWVRLLRLDSPTPVAPAASPHVIRSPTRTRVQISPIPRGLTNQGNTCYLNSVFQCLVRINAMSDESAFATTSRLDGVAGFWRDVQRSLMTSPGVVPLEVPDELLGEGEMRQQQDPQEFLNRFINSLHAETHNPENQKSIVHETFRAEYQQTVTCNQRSQLVEPYTELYRIFHFPSHNGSVALAPDNFLSQSRDPRDTMDCPVCQNKNRHEVVYTLTLSHAPAVFMIVLARYRADPSGAFKIATQVDFPEAFAATTTAADGEQRQHNYSLMASINHCGTTLNSGHYIAYAKERGMWYRFDDATVTQVQDIRHVVSYGQFDPYILFYERY